MTTPVGCFGSTLYHDAASRRCGACPHFAACVVEVDANKIKLDEWYAVLLADKAEDKKATRKIRRMAAAAKGPIAAPTAKPAVVAATHTTTFVPIAGKSLNKKPKELVDKLVNKGIDFEAYKEGINPFLACGNKYVWIGMQYLLDNREATKDQMIDYYVAQLKWGLGTASSHTNILFEVLDYLGIVTLHGSKAYLR